ncbi:hypothetical protein SEA_GILGAMESH_8 [Streptomyces phage Gilgamesh]|uniref:Lipoprotein n=1 Tax=Streptomyces phage Gilgamesh TaxID=2599890 RepID=A0A5J6TQU6_9CAUD|nr:hypothetical protein QEH35_gp008 [Streptomyces phage Gilgamesh]QFG13200.1 hypothetical protein SEA_GILGAMESH_8 [Streptomyces phage Gilgamesh]
MGRHIWGKTAGALVLAAVVAAASGCSSSDDEGSGKPAATAAAAAKAPSVGEATATFQEAVTKFDTDGGCLEQAPGTCWEQMQALMAPARDLRKAANAHKETGPEFWSEAYVLIDTMETGIAVGEDQGVPAVQDTSLTNRDDVLGSAHKLSDWLTAHPVQ